MPESPPESSRKARWLAMGGGGFLTVVVVVLIASRPGVETVWDQTFIGYDLATGYPHLEGGIASHLIVGLVNEVVPYDDVTSNTLFRALAALLYVGAAGLLAWSVTGTERPWAFALFLLLVVTSRFPFLWLSSELFAGAFLMLLLWSLMREYSFVVTASFLVLFSLAKADLALPGLLLGIYLVARPAPEPRWRRAMVLGGLAAALVVPSLFTESYYAQFGGRTWVSFSQHYGALVERHQLGWALPGFLEGARYRARAFPGAESIPQAVWMYPRTYLDFVVLSVTESVVNTLRAKLLFLLPVAVYLFARLHAHWRVTVLLILSSLVPIVLISYMHVRYQARFYPLALFVVYLGLRTDGIGPRRERWVMAGLTLLLAWQVVDLLPVLQSAYWLPD